MEHFHGRPVWHCSVSPKDSQELAAMVLAGVGEGDVMFEEGGVAIHMRRHVTDVEMEGLEVRDIRGTWEATKRLAACRKWLPIGWSE